MIDHSRQ